MDRKIAVVTGGTGGIGTAICRRLATNYKVVACYFKNGKHDEVLQWQTAQKKQVMILKFFLQISSIFLIVKHSLIQLWSALVALTS